MTALDILVVDDDAGHRNALKTLLADWGFAVFTAADGKAAVDLAASRAYDLILMDVRMPGMSGIDAMRRILDYNPSIPVLVMTAFSDVETAVSAMKAGAYDYLTKPLDFDDLKLTLDRALDHASLKTENAALRGKLASDVDADGLVGTSDAMRRLVDMARTIAASEATVLVAGESGTGKEVLARFVHNRSPRAAKPFVAVNCAALTETLLESELFGHEKGAFTGADRRREGRIQAAEGGTVFLDEIGEMPFSMQAKLLRVIQEREIQRPGGDRPVKVDVRIIAATNRDLAADAEAGRFRQDLFYRLNVVTLDLPPLRARGSDIPALAVHFLNVFAEKNKKRIKGFTPGAMDRLLKYSWPGNVRELENAVERAVVLLVGEYVSERELPPTVAAAGAPSGEADGSAGGEGFGGGGFNGLTMDEIQRRAAQAALTEAGGNKSEAARRLGITRKTLLAKLREEDA